MESEFIGGDLHGERHVVEFGRSAWGRTGQEYHRRLRGTEVVFLAQGPHHKCPGCWIDDVVPFGIEDVVCATCDRVLNLKLCRRCHAPMHPVGQDPARMIWTCDCPAGGEYHPRVPSRCPRCTSHETAPGEDGEWACDNCRTTYKFSSAHFEETPAWFSADSELAAF